MNERQPITLTSVDQRDGEQQRLGVEVVTEDMRIEALDQLIQTGIKRLEIGHLGNTGRGGRFEGDQAHALRAISHILQKEKTDPVYQDVELQFLFGSQTEIIGEALEVLEDWPKDRTIIHVYDRLPDGLRNLASNPYDHMESARRVCRAADIALAKGFTRFSISGEGATDCSVEQALEYYSYIVEYLEAHGATSVNVNLANTYGSPPEGEWDSIGLEYFDTSIKYVAQDIDVTTSVHVHRDDQSAVEFSIAAIKAGFDSVEGTLFGMGERSGNVALCDVMIRLLEIARIEVESTRRPRSTFRLGQSVMKNTLFSDRYVPSSILDNLHTWYESSTSIADLYGTRNRFEGTGFGDPEAYNAGSGPHDNATEKALSNPARYPLWKNYLRIAIPHATLGRPEAEGIIAVDPEIINSITVNGHAGGGATDRIIKGEVISIDSRAQAIKNAQAEIEAILKQAA